MKIYLDFDGTVVEHAYPKIGRANFGCAEVIRKLQDAGHEIILNTYRVEIRDGSFENAVNYLNNILWSTVGADQRDDERFHPLPITQYTTAKKCQQPWHWDSMKKSGEMYIDDFTLNIPLKAQVMQTPGNMVDWQKLDIEFQANGIY